MTNRVPTTAAEVALAELRAHLEANTTRLTELASVIRGLSLNDVLRSELITIGSSGIEHRATSTPYASVGAWSTSSAEVTITSHSPASSAPPDGIGVIALPPQAAVVWPLAGTELTIYGTAGDQVLIALWAKPQAPLVTVARGNVDGGTP